MASLLSGTQSSRAGLQRASTLSRNLSRISLFISGCDMTLRMFCSVSPHSTMVWPKNILRDTGRHDPEAAPEQSKRNPVRSPYSPKWCVGIMSTRADLSLSAMLPAVASSSSERPCRLKQSRSLLAGRISTAGGDHVSFLYQGGLFRQTPSRRGIVPRRAGAHP
jgi:hypothetical protein